jgi:hypothetical protein
LLDEGVFQLMMVLNGKTAQEDMEIIATTLQGIVRFPNMAVLVQASHHLPTEPSQSGLMGQAPGFDSAARTAWQARKRLL